jgi:hypothetical protein
MTSMSDPFLTKEAARHRSVGRRERNVVVVVGQKRVRRRRGGFRAGGRKETWGVRW